jgi:hypothetical protein
LGELGEMAMAAARAFTASAIAAAKAEEAILADKYFVPEVGRARACGAKDAAESFQKISRAVRLTLMLEMNLAEIVRDIRAGGVTYLGGIAVRKDAGGDAGAPDERARSLRRSAGVLAGPSDARASTAGHLIDIERPDTLFRAPFRETVEHICGDIGATVDWTAWRVIPPAPTLDLGVRPPWRSPPVPARPPG